jgi:hypothetical protein
MTRVTRDELLAAPGQPPETQQPGRPGTTDAAPARRQPAGEVGLAAAAALAGEYVDLLIVGTVREVHRAVAERVFSTVDRAPLRSGRLVRRCHDTVAAGVYTGLSAGLRVTTAGLRAAEAREIGPRLQAGPRGRQLLSAVNGLIGDRLRDQRPELAIELAVRHRGRDVQLRRPALTEAFPAATENLAVFLHGLGENDDSWNLRRGEHGGTYGSRLAAETDWTPVFLRANTGLPIAENGRVLASLMERLVAQWPSQVRRIALVGHSMGGLIMRAACALQDQPAPDHPGPDQPGPDHPGPGEHGPLPWTHRVTNVVTLGTPHLGAPLEHVVNTGARALGVLPESAPFGRILEYRSVGILDLRRGLAADVQRLPHARYHLVAATLAGTPRHLVSAVLGDLLVRYPSATGVGRRGDPMFPGADIVHVPGADHFALLNHPDVYEALRTWLTAPAPAPSPRSAP